MTSGMFPRPSPSNPDPPIRVGVAVVIRRRGDGPAWILIGHRFPGPHLPDLWEFPGGKMLPGETGAQCAVREVREEMGVLVEVQCHLLDRTYGYADRTVELEFYLCRYLDGMPAALECQAVRWVRPDHLDCYPFPDANQPVLESLRRVGGL
jgi:mutator protein MutT